MQSAGGAEQLHWRSLLILNVAIEMVVEVCLAFGRANSRIAADGVDRGLLQAILLLRHRNHARILRYHFGTRPEVGNLNQGTMSKNFDRGFFNSP